MAESLLALAQCLFGELAFGDVLDGEQHHRFITVTINNAPSIEHYCLLPHGWEFMLDFEVGQRGVIRNDFFQRRAELGYVPLLVSQTMKGLSFNCPSVHSKFLQERRLA